MVTGVPRAAQPSTPASDIAAFRRRPSDAIAPVVGEDLAAFCQSGVSVIVASRGHDGQAIAGQALGGRVASSGAVRVLLEKPANQALIDAISLGGGVAATFTRPSTHRSVQLKARSAEIVEPAPADLELLEQQLAGFAAELIGVGYDAAFATTYCAHAPETLAAVLFDPNSAFVQTPGPGAGAAIAP